MSALAFNDNGRPRSRAPALEPITGGDDQMADALRLLVEELGLGKPQSIKLVAHVQDGHETYDTPELR